MLPVENILRVFYETNGKIFHPSELKKIYMMYENKNLNEVCELFKLNCEAIRSNMMEKIDFDTEFSEIEDSFYKYTGAKRNSEYIMNNSYKVVNEKIIKLKKFEFDFTNLIEIAKNFLVAQELAMRIVFINENHQVKNESMFGKEVNADEIKFFYKIYF